MNTKIIPTGALVILLMICIIQNYNIVEIKFLLWNIKISSVIVVFIPLIIGIIIGWIWALIWKRQSSGQK